MTSEIDRFAQFRLMGGMSQPLGHRLRGPAPVMLPPSRSMTEQRLEKPRSAPLARERARDNRSIAGSDHHSAGAGAGADQQGPPRWHQRLRHVLDTHSFWAP